MWLVDLGIWVEEGVGVEVEDVVGCIVGYVQKQGVMFEYFVKYFMQQDQCYGCVEYVLVGFQYIEVFVMQDLKDLYEIVIGDGQFD